MVPTPGSLRPIIAPAQDIVGRRALAIIGAENAGPDASEKREMALARSLQKQGSLLFRWRSYVPLVFLPLLVVSVMNPERIEASLGETIGDSYEGFCYFLVFVGLAIRAFTVGFVPRGTSGRNTRGQVASVLNTKGMYSITRNPLYLGNTITYLGIALFTQDLIMAALFALFLVVYYERIILAEETFLQERFGADYDAWASRVPAFFPKPWLWQKPDMAFSFRTVLKREYPGLLAAVLMLFVIEFVGDYFEEGTWSIEPAWAWAVGAALVVYVVLRSLKKHTSVLRVSGR